MKDPPKLDLPENALKWAVDAVKLFKHQEVLERFLWLVKKWYHFEVSEQNWGHGGKFGTVDRPKPVGDWIN